MGTVELAKEEREKQRFCEVEVSYGGEADLHKHLTLCDKNPDHLTFLPVDSFNLDHLPLGYKNNDFLNYIIYRSDLTVRVDVRHVSERRPKNCPGSDTPYPFYSCRGSDMLRVGTGWVSLVKKRFRLGHTNCDCRDCRLSPAAVTPTACIYIYTAAHVVFDRLEAQHTTCHLFFNRGSSPGACDDVVSLSDMSCLKSDVIEDCCEMIYVTRNLGLADRLDNLLKEADHLQNSIPNACIPLLTSSREVPADNSTRTLTVIVSHPHGCSKQVTVGYYHSLDAAEDGRVQYLYTTSTCPGSSGAPVLVLMKDFQWGYKWLTYTHCGNCERNRGLNYSVDGLPVRWKLIQSK